MMLGALLLGGLGICAILAYYFWDVTIAKAANSVDPAWRRTEWILGFKQLGRVLAPLWLIALCAWACRRPRILTAALIALLLAAILVGGMKATVQRPRPGREISAQATDPFLESFRNGSFPSGDAATAFALAVVAASVLAGGWKILPYVLAAGVGAMRVAGYHHYLSDAFAGAAAGLLCGWCALYLSRRIERRSPWCRNMPRAFLFWLVLLMSLGLIISESISGRFRFVAFLKVAGPVLAGLLILWKGRSWLRWLSGRGFGTRVETRRRMLFAAIMLLALGALVILPCLGWTTLFDRDEGYYVGCASEMLDRGEFFIPHFSGEPWLEKPPLGYWAMAGSMTLLGRNEFAARLPNALAALVAILLLFRLASRLYNPRVGVMASVMLGTSFLFADMSRMALLDGFLVAAVLIAMSGFWAFLQGAERRGLLGFYLGCGLGGLAKGPLGVALPIIAAMGYIIWMRSWGLLRRMRPLPGALLALLVVGIWMLPGNLLTNGELVYELAWVRTLRPVFVPLQGHGGANFWEYLLLLPAYVPILFLGFLPWCLFLLMGWRQLRTEEPRRSEPMAFLLGWIVAQLAVFSLVRTKLPHHILPIMPPLAVLCAVALVRLMTPEKETKNPWHCRGRRAMAICLAAVSVGIMAIPLGAGFWKDWIWFLPAGLVMAVAAWRVNAMLKRKRYEPAFLALTVALCLCFGLVWQIGLPRFEKGKSAWRVSQFLKNSYDAEELKAARIGLKSYREVSIVFYLDRSADKVDDLPAYLRDPSPALVIIPEAKLREAVVSKGDMPYQVLWKEPAWIPEKNKWVNLMVITNQLDRKTASLASNEIVHNKAAVSRLDTFHMAGLRWQEIKACFSRTIAPQWNPRHQPLLLLTGFLFPHDQRKCS